MNTSSSTKVELIELISCFNWDNISIPVQTDAINIVGQLPTSLDVTCCVRLHTLLHVVACGCVMLGVVERSLKPVKLLSQQLLKFLFFRDRRRVAQQCYIGLHSSSNIVEATHAHWHCFTKSYGLHPSHDALRFLTLLEVVASVYLYLYRICPYSRADINGGPDEWPKKIKDMRI